MVGDEWFERESATFRAPVPVSALDTADVSKVVSDDLIGKTLKTPTLYELIQKNVNVSMLSVHRGASLYTTVAPASLTDFLGFLIKGALKGIDPGKSIAAALDLSAMQKLIEAIETKNVADLQVVYFPGIDIFTHVSEDPLERQVRYLELVTDKRVGELLDEYRKKDALDRTYVIVISDHGQIPTLNDDRHKLGTDDEHSPFAVLKRSGYRVRKPLLTLGEPTPPGQNAKPFQIFNGQRLVPIAEYLKRNPRPDLIDLNRRMQWLGVGPFGDRAGDIVLLAKACTQVPIEQRFYFASVSHYTWHGSACAQDSQIPFILAQVGGSGERMRNLLRKFGGAAPTELMMTPLVRELFK